MSTLGKDALRRLVVPWERKVSGARKGVASERGFASHQPSAKGNTEMVLRQVYLKIPGSIK